MKIGLFDSGLGGLTILNSVRSVLPEYDYVYYGDTKNVPYGNKTESEIYRFTKDAVAWLFNEGAQIVILACNTASAETLRKLQDDYLPNAYPERRILGVIIPTIEALVDSTARNVLLTGTQRTIESKKFQRELFKLNIQTITIIEAPTPALVPLIEEMDLNGALAVMEKTINERRGEIDTVVLGCTHYVVLKERLRSLYTDIQIISQDEIIPYKLENYLLRHNEFENKLTRGGSQHIHLTHKNSASLKKTNDLFTV